jgi:hypothetical protein
MNSLAILEDENGNGGGKNGIEREMATKETYVLDPSIPFSKAIRYSPSSFPSMTNFTKMTRLTQSKPQKPL